MHRDEHANHTQPGHRSCADSICDVASEVIRAIRQGLFLDLPGLECNGCDVEAKVFRELNRIEFGRVESPSDSLKRTRQRIGCGAVARGAEAPADTGIGNPHEAPSSLADHGVENLRREILNPGPVRANRLLQRIQPVGKDTSLAKKNGVQSQDCSRLGVAANAGTRAGRPGDSTCPDCCPLSRTTSACPDSSVENPVASATLGTACRLLPLRS